MAKQAENVLPFNSQAVTKATAKGGQRIEYRIRDVRGLVLDVLPSGVATYRFVYHVRLGAVRKLRKLTLGSRDELTLHDARKRAEELRAAVAAGADPMGDGQALRTALTFEELAQQFLSDGPLAATTKRVYGDTLRKDVFPVIGRMPVDAVTTDHILAICKRIEGTGAQVQSDRTKSTIGGVFKWGLRQRLVKANPCRGIGRRSHKVARTRTPTDAEIAALWEATTHTSSKLSKAMRNIVRLGILCGQRRAEICGARVSELQLEGDAPVWIIPGDVNKRGKIIEGRTKNGREQHVPLSQPAAAIFREALREGGAGEFVFPADMSKVKIGKTPRYFHIAPDSVSMSMRRLRAVAGIEDIGIHDMRRACSNWLKDQGVSREVRDLLLNHKDPSVTEQHYSQGARMEKQVRAALDAWASHVWEITGQGAATVNVVKLRA